VSRCLAQRAISETHVFATPDKLDWPQTFMLSCAKLPEDLHAHNDFAREGALYVVVAVLSFAFFFFLQIRLPTCHERTRLPRQGWGQSFANEK
jgi:hypothetical protein